MNMRLDDINQKENSMRLSLQTVDYRLAKLEEVTLQTAESLHNLSQILIFQQQQLAQENATTGADSSSTAVVSGPYGSSYSGGESSDGSEEASRKPFKFISRRQDKSDERLRPFTDYSKRHKRPPFSRSVTIATGVPIRGEFKELQDRKKLSPPKPKKPAAPKLGSELYHRRRSKALNKLKLPFAAEYSPLEESPEITGVGFESKPSQKVKFCDQQQPRAGSQRRSSFRTTHSLPEELGPNVAPLDHIPENTGVASRLGPMLLKMPSIDGRRANPPSSLPPLNPPLAPITPIITPSRSEYTSITDDIDCSGLDYRSPNNSPVTPRRTFSGFEVDVDLYTKKGSPPKELSRMEANQLKIAEESENDQMEMIIRKRMRQISLTETESISDIAKIMINEMEHSSSSSDEQGCYSDDEFCLSGRHAPQYSTLKHVNSEPSLKMKSDSFDALEMQEFRYPPKCGSASPPPPTGKGTQDAVKYSGRLDNGDGTSIPSE